MRSPRFGANRRVAWLISAAGFMAATGMSVANEWGDEVQLASCYSDGCGAYSDVDACCSDICGCSDVCSACGSGYCFNVPMCDELMCRLAPCMEKMAASGILYNPVATQFYQGVASGGAEQEFAYGGKIDQFLILDAGKLGLWQGLTVALHAETRFGDDINQQAVPFAPANVAMLYPKAGEHDTAITGLGFIQALTPEVQLMFGKFNSVDLFNDLYPQTGRGINGFMNASMVVPLAAARVAPLSFMGAGVRKMRGKQIQGALLVYDTQNVATTSGFDNMFDNGVNILAFWRFFTNVYGLPGSHGFAGFWSTGEFVAFDPTGFVIVPDEGIVAVPQDGAYTLLYFYEQTLWQHRCRPQRKVSFLSEWGIADDLTSPVGWSANLGFQATGLSSTRPNDAFGIGYFHTGISDDLTNLFSPVLTLQNVDGVEMYYSAAVAKGLQLTANLQIIEPANVQNDTAVVFGLRLKAGL